MRRKRVTYRPSKAAGAFGMVFGLIFVIIGVTMAIPTFGPFGILWTLMAIGIPAYNAYCAFGKGYAGPEIHIEDAEETDRPSSAEARLQELRGLYDRSLITQEEYEQKRQEILRDL